MIELAADPLVQGFTTNPTLMRQAGIDDYATFVKELTTQITEHPISFEVISDDFAEMERQALLPARVRRQRLREDPDHRHLRRERGTADGAARRGRGVGERDRADDPRSGPRRRRRARRRTAGGDLGVRGPDRGCRDRPGARSWREAKSILRAHPNLELLWASPREVLNVVQADQVGCDIITLTPDLMKKLPRPGSRSRRVLARHRADVPRRRGRREVRALTSPSTRASVFEPVASLPDQGEWQYGLDRVAGDVLDRPQQESSTSATHGVHQRLGPVAWNGSTIPTAGNASRGPARRERMIAPSVLGKPEPGWWNGRHDGLKMALRI